MGICRKVGIEHDLGNASSIAHVDEDDGPVVPSVRYPSKQHDLAIDICRAQAAAIMGALELIDESRHKKSPFSSVERERASSAPGSLTQPYATLAANTGHLMDVFVELCIYVAPSAASPRGWTCAQPVSASLAEILGWTDAVCRKRRDS
jgi:hypothetical protein